MQLRSLPADPAPATEFRGDVVFLFPEKHRWIAYFKLFKPTMWLMPIWALLCGMLTNEELVHPPHAIIIALALLLIGPLQGLFLTFSKVFFEPDRDTGRLVSPKLAVSLIVVTLLGIALCAHWLGTLPIILIASSLLLALVREANPFNLQHQGIHSAIDAMNFVGIPWFMGASLLSSFSIGTLVPALVFTFGYVGIAILKDIIRLEEDRMLGIRSLGMILGSDLGIWIVSFVIDTALLGAAILGMGGPTGLFLLTILALQVLMQGIVIRYGRPDWYLPIATLLFALGMMLAATPSHITMVKL